MGKNNKKKSKGKPTETNKGVAVGNGEVSVPENRDSASERNYQKHSSSDGESQSVGFQESDVELEKRSLNEVNGDGNMKPHEEGRVACPEKQVEFSEELKSLKDEILDCIQKEAKLEKAIEELQSGRDSYTQKEAFWGAKLEKLQSEVTSCILKEVNLKEELRILSEESSSKEVLVKEMFLKLENANSRLQKQVLELEESRNCLLQDNEILMNNFSLLQVRVQQLEQASMMEAKTKFPSSSEDKSARDQVQVNHHLGEELVLGKKEAIEKENDLHHSATNHDPSLTIVDPMSMVDTSTKLEKGLVQANHLTSHDDSSGQAFETIPIHDAIGGGHFTYLLASSNTSRSIVLPQLPVEDEIQVEEADVHGNEPVQDPSIPLSDAPLIGAPFRIISFFAKYVSGADLVREPGSKIGR